MPFSIERTELVVPAPDRVRHGSADEGGDLWPGDRNRLLEAFRTYATSTLGR
ncbi:hypothetical protein ACIG5E_00050 [Kitasatospora sp. NPDC053057]|uniref:hypothetical protein n=1 Tax=Kitasatospora sp. NPDC053057 TaxID=3364062 RepID=UPI0037C84CC6